MQSLAYSWVEEEGEGGGEEWREGEEGGSREGGKVGQKEEGSGRTQVKILED